jgi:chromate transporter
VVFIGGSFGQIGAIALGAVAGLWLCRGDGSARPGHLGFSVSRRHGECRAGAVRDPVPDHAAGDGKTGSQGLALFDAFYRSGRLVFGGGHVVLPLLQAEVVTPGWVSNADFLAGYGMAQAVPGPLFTFAAYLGAIGPAPMVSPALRLHSSRCPCRGCCWSTACCRSGTRCACAPLRRPPCAAPMPPSSASLAPRSTIRSGPAPCSPRATFAVALAGFLLLTVWKLAPWIVVVLLGTIGAILRQI